MQIKFKLIETKFKKLGEKNKKHALVHPKNLVDFNLIPLDFH